MCHFIELHFGRPVQEVHHRDEHPEGFLADMPVQIFLGFPFLHEGEGVVIQRILVEPAADTTGFKDARLRESLNGIQELLAFVGLNRQSQG